MKKDSKSESSANLRKQAEAVNRKRPLKSSSSLDDTKMRKLIQELEVHQIELELQNEELRVAKAKITAYAEKYAELYDFAPSGYFTLANNGEIIELNLCGSQMLGKERMFLKTQRFGLYVSDDDKPVFNQFLEKIFNYKSAQTCEVALLENGSPPIYVNLSGTVTENGEQCLIIATDITSRKKAEKELLKNELLYRTLFEEANEGIVYLSTDLRIKMVNAAFERMHGYSKEELVNMSLLDLDSPEAFQLSSERVAKLMNGETIRFEVEHVHKDGHIFPLGVSSNLIHIEGEPVIQSFNRDISEQKQAYELLRESEKQYANLFNNFLDSVAVHQIVLDTEGKPVDYIFLQANASFETQTGLRIAEILGKRASEVVPGIGESPLIGIYGKVASTGEPINFEQYFEPLGRYFHISAFQVGQGRFCTVFQDVSDIRVAEKALKESEEQFRQVFEHSVVGKSMTTMDGKLQINLAFCEMLGYSKDQLLKMNWQSITHPDDVENDQAIIQSIISGEKASARWEKRYIHQNGSIVWADISTILQRDNEGKPLFFNTSVVDITKRRNTEELLHKSEERYRNLLTHLETGIVVHAPDTSIIMNNLRASELLGLSEDQLSGKLAIDPSWKFVNEKNVTLLPEEYPVNLILSTKKPFRNNILGVVKPGINNIVWLTVNGLPFFDREGEITEVLISFIDITELKQSEIKLKASEAKFRNLVWYMQVGVLLQGPKAEIILSNPKALELLGITEDQLLGKTSFDPDWNVIHEDGTPFPGTTHPVPQAIASRQPVHDVVMGVYHPLKGDRVWLLVNAEPQVNENGDIQQVVCTFVDITERKKAEEALFESERKFRETVTNLDEGYYNVTMDGELLEHNQAFSRILGFDSNADLKGIHLPDFLQHPEERKKYLEAISANHSISNQQIEVKTQAGEKKSVLVSAHLVKDADGLPMRIEGIFLDITERIRTEDALHRHAERLQNLHKIDKAILSPVETPEAIIQKALQHIRSLLSSQHASIGIFDFENEALQLFAANIRNGTTDQAEKFMIDKAYGDLEILRQNRMDVVEDISAKSSPPELLRILQSEGIMSCINVPLVSGEKLIGAMNLGWADPRAFTPEELEIASEVADEITIAIEQVRLRQITKQYASDLEKRVEDRTAQLTAANKELEAFSYSVSHDLRAPLRHINGYISILSKHLQNTLPEKEKHYFDTISESARQMGVLIDDLLHFSRTGRQEMNLTDLDMNVVLQDALQVIKHDSNGRNIKWEIAPLPKVLGDYALLRIVWLNLLSNAVKFLRANVLAQIEIGVVDDANEFVFFVRDNGVGFDMQYAQKLFGVFERLHSAKEFEGTGIGLANVRRIISRHGGRTWAEAEVDKGATFYFTLPKKL